MSDDKPTVGFIGLGLMGQGATKCLVRTGYTVTGFDIDPAKNDLANQHGVTLAQNAQEVAIASDVVLV